MPGPPKPLGIGLFNNRKGLFFLLLHYPDDMIYTYG